MTLDGRCEDMVDSREDVESVEDYLRTHINSGEITDGDELKLYQTAKRECDDLLVTLHKLTDKLEDDIEERDG